jgi:hypothetical protein
MSKEKKNLQEIIKQRQKKHRTEEWSLLKYKKKAGRLESHLLWSFYDRSHEKTVYDKPGAYPVSCFYCRLKSKE